MKSRSKNAKAEGPKNAIEAGTIPPPTTVRTGFRALTGAMPKGWKKASDALDYVRAVPTIFPDFNRATRVGGVPLRRITTVHGPTHEGKTAFIAGLLKSFIDLGHLAGYVDAEHATDLAFFDKLLRQRTEDIPNFVGQRPRVYEETVDAADEFLDWMVRERAARWELWREQLKLKKEAKLPPLPPELDLAGILVIDSLNKLTPENEMKRVTKEGGEALDKGLGRQRANMNQAWLDHVVPRLGPAETALVLIVQERDADDLKPWERPTLKGGRASAFDASIIARVTKGSAVSRGEKAEKQIFGFRHNVRIWKSKVGEMDSSHSDAFFHMSNGQLIASGFDAARDAVVMGKELGLITGDGWLSWNKKRWNGEHNAVVALEKDPASLAMLLEQIRVRTAPEKAA